MGLFSSLFGMTGPGNMAAAMNALVAKHMMQRVPDEYFIKMYDNMALMLAENGMPNSRITPTIKGLVDCEADMCCMFSVTFNYMGIDPILPKCFSHGKWNHIDRPLIAMHGAEEEVRLARIDIFRRYQIDIPAFAL